MTEMNKKCPIYNSKNAPPGPCLKDQCAWFITLATNKEEKPISNCAIVFVGVGSYGRLVAAGTAALEVKPPPAQKKPTQPTLPGAPPKPPVTRAPHHKKLDANTKAKLVHIMADQFATAFSKRIAKYVLDKNITLALLAEKIGLPKNHGSTSIGKWLDVKSSPTDSYTLPLAYVLRAPEADIIAEVFHHRVAVRNRTAKK